MATAARSLSEIDKFFEEVGSAKERALLLDYDGTLAPFQTNRKAALPYLGIPELLISIIMGQTRTRVVLITGRPAMELKTLLPFAPTPEIWGSHGLERLMPDGTYAIAEIPPAAAELLRTIDGCLVAEGLEPYMERKPGAIAMHWRGLSDTLANGICERVTRVWNGLRPKQMLLLSPFDGGMEFRLRQRNKGDAVRQLLAEMREATPVAYLGDDYTDEDAFQALDDRGLSVLVRDEYRPTAAHSWIRPPDGVLDFLAKWLQACKEGKQG